MHFWGISAFLNCGMKIAVRHKSLARCEAFAALFLMCAVLLGHSLGQTSEPVAPSAQEPAPSSPEQTPQPENSTAVQARTHAARRRPTIDDHVKILAKSLNLTEPQQSAVKKILEERQAATLRLRTDGTISGSERIDRLRALQDQTIQKIRGVLDDEQRKKYDPLAVRKVPPAPDQKSVEDWIKATTPK